MENENPSEAIKLYTQVLNSPLSLDEVDALKEDSTLALSKLYSKNGDPSSIEELLKSARTFFEKISKAKSAKIGMHFKISLSLSFCSENLGGWCLVDRWIRRHQDEHSEGEHSMGNGWKANLFGSSFAALFCWCSLSCMSCPSLAHPRVEQAIYRINEPSGLLDSCSDSNRWQGHAYWMLFNPSQHLPWLDGLHKGQSMLLSRLLMTSPVWIKPECSSLPFMWSLILRTTLICCLVLLLYGVP